MPSEQTELLLRQLLEGRIELAEAVSRLAPALTADVGEAQVDLDRARRCGFPEVVYGQGKTLPALEKIFHALQAAGTEPFATRIDPAQAHDLLKTFPAAHYNELGRTFRVPLPGKKTSSSTDGGKIGIVTAGTCDRPVAEEARETALWCGCQVELIVDVGVAGPHRFPAQVGRLKDVDAVVVVAGMEAALPSVVGGYVSCPVIGVPTSVGYGTSFGGITALLGMLNSCAANVTVVNIDAGFKGGYLAALIAQRVARARAEGHASVS